MCEFLLSLSSLCIVCNCVSRALANYKDCTVFVTFLLLPVFKCGTFISTFPVFIVMSNIPVCFKTPLTLIPMPAYVTNSVYIDFGIFIY